MTQQRRHRLSLAARLAALLFTSYFLIATSRPVDPPGEVSRTSSQVCTHPAQSVSFDVTGTCGPAGIIIVRSPADECLITVEGAAAVGLPAGGRFHAFSGPRSVDLLKDPWTLSEVLPDPASPTLPLPPDAGATDAKPDTTFAVVGDSGTTFAVVPSTTLPAAGTNHPQPRTRECNVDPRYVTTPRLSCAGATVCSGSLVRR